MSEEKNPLSILLEYLGIVKKRFPVVLLLAVFLGCVGFTIVALLPDRYEATTTILVDPQKIPERYVTSTISTDLAQRLSTITQEVLSATRLQEIIDQFHLYRDIKGRTREEIVEMMRKDIS